MEDGLEQHMSILIQMREQQQEKRVVQIEKKQAEEQVHPIGLSLVHPSGSQHTTNPKTPITSTNSGS